MRKIEHTYYHGVYRGIVMANDDSDENLLAYSGRCRVHVPEVYGPYISPEHLPWAYMSCPSYGGMTGTGSEGSDMPQGTVSIPTVGSTVWVMFEQGNPERPVYLGTWYAGQKGSGVPELPPLALAATSGDVGLGGSTEIARYPGIYLQQFPWHPAMYVRACGGGTPNEEGQYSESGEHLLEFVLGTMKIQVKDVSSLDSTGVYKSSRSIHLLTTSENENIVLEAQAGTIQLKARDIEVIAENKEDDDYEPSLSMRVGTFDDDGNTVQEGSLSLLSSKEVRVHSVETLSLLAGTPDTKGEISATAKKTSGFEQHDSE